MRLVSGARPAEHVIRIGSIMNDLGGADGGLASRVLAWWQAESLAIDSVLVGVSGGADSVGLLRAVVAEGSIPDVRFVVGHVDHGLRGADGSSDARWVGGLADVLGLDHEVVCVDLGESESEESARRCRYGALRELACRHGCQAIMVAHTQDDQVETVLHQLLRGTGLKGLAGMSGCQSLGDDLLLLRPLLDVGRSEIESWLSDLGQLWREDATNSDTRWTRNRIRHDLLPALERDYNPRVRQALLRVSRLSAEAVGIVADAVEGVWGDCVLEQTPSVVRLCAETLVGLPESLVRALLLELWRRQEWPRQAMTFSHWRALAGLVGGSGALDLPGGVSARRNGGVVLVERG
jgi:tRNA(Ile)-lysidine synthase